MQTLMMALAMAAAATDAPVLVVDDQRFDLAKMGAERGGERWLVPSIEDNWDDQREKPRWRVRGTRVKLRVPIG